MTGLAPIAQIALLGLIILGYYGKVVRLVGEPLARRVVSVFVDGTAITRRWSDADIAGVVRLLLAGVLQLGLLATLVAVLPVATDDLLPSAWDIRLTLLGVPLGIAEAGLATYVAYLGSRVAESVRRGDTPTTIEGWLTVARGGWIR